MTVAGSRAGWPEVPRASGWPCRRDGARACCSGSVGKGVDTVPGGDGVVGPAPAGLNFQLSSAGAAGEAGGGVQDLAARVILSDVVDHGCDLRRCVLDSLVDDIGLLATGPDAEGLYRLADAAYEKRSDHGEYGIEISHGKHLGAGRADVNRERVPGGLRCQNASCRSRASSPAALRQKDAGRGVLISLGTLHERDLQASGQRCRSHWALEIMQAMDAPSEPYQPLWVIVAVFAHA